MRHLVRKIRTRPEDAHQSRVQYIDGVSYKVCLYRTKNGERLHWLAGFPLPNLNDRVRIKMCEIGDATVVGFFREPGELGWLVGVIVRTDDPIPDGLKGHTLQRDGQLCLHGTEFKPI